MKTIYINTKQAEENRIIIVENGLLTGFEQETVGRENKKGDIYKGVVARVEKSLDAAFVDLGGKKNGFLPLKEIAAAADGAAKAEEGDSILVQIKKDHSGSKGAGLTGRISLAGCYLVLMPDKDGRKILSKHSDHETRRDMQEVLRHLKVPAGMGVIVRTSGLGRESGELQWDLDSYLLPLWRTIESVAETEKGPVLVYRESSLQLRAVRDYFRGDDDQIVCDGLECYNELRDFVSIVFPDRLGQIRYFSGDGTMIPDSVEAQIGEVFEREVNTPSGARVVFDSTEAMVAVDVNSAKIRGGEDIEATALQSNMEAAAIIARHLQLRDLAGLVVIDFIDMENEKNIRQLEQYFVSLLRKDRARVRHSPISQFGLMEISRQRLSRSVEESHAVMCERCRGTGRRPRDDSFALRLLRQLRRSAAQPEVCALLVQSPVAAATYLLNEKRVEMRRLEDETNCEIFIVPNGNLYPPDYTVRTVKDDSPLAESYSYADKKSDAATVAQIRDRWEARRVGRQKQPLINTLMPTQSAPRRGGWSVWMKKIMKVFSAAEKPAARPAPRAPKNRPPNRGDNRQTKSGDNFRRAKNNGKPAPSNLPKDAAENKMKRNRRGARHGRPAAESPPARSPRPPLSTAAESPPARSPRPPLSTAAESPPVTIRPSAETPSPAKNYSSALAGAKDRAANKPAQLSPPQQSAPTNGAPAAQKPSPAKGARPDSTGDVSSSWQAVETVGAKKTESYLRRDEVELPAAAPPAAVKSAAAPMRQVETSSDTAG